MTNKVAALSLIIVFALAAGNAQAEKLKFEKLSPVDGPCLFLLDENLNEFGDPVNTPCSLGETIITHGDPISDDARAKYGKPQRVDKASPTLRGGSSDDVRKDSEHRNDRSNR